MAAAEPERTVPYVEIGAQYLDERDSLLAVIDRVLGQGQHVGGPEVEAFERAVAGRCGVAHAIALNSGTDALEFTMEALGIGAGDEVITPPNSFVASTAAIVQIGAKPVFADVLANQNIDPSKIEEAITDRTKAIMPVHLTGRMADMTRIMEIAKKNGLFVIEDAAQAIASTFDGNLAGSVGNAGCFSCHPLKNLNACGDGGFVSTNDGDLAERVRTMRNHGIVNRNEVVSFGHVSRMDTLQAAILLHRLGRLDETITSRSANTARYRELLDPEFVFIPEERKNELNTYHTFVVQLDRRDDLSAHLAAHGIDTTVHYPIPIHLQPAAAFLGYKKGSFPVAEEQAGRILSLPIHQHLSADDIDYVANTINGFYR